MEQLIEKLNQLLASTFTMYLKTHQFHWNVEGQDFHQYHRYLGKLYQEIWESVDTTAEQIKALNGIAQGSLTQYKEISTIRDQLTVPSLQEMNSILYRDNESIISILNDIHEEATKQKAYGLLNYIEGRIDIHRKHGWMLRASITSSVSEEVVKQQQEPSIILDEEVKTYTLNVKDL